MTSKSGKLTNKAGEYEVRFERTLPHSAETVWDAITNPEKLKLWFTDIDMDFKPGGGMTIASYGVICKVSFRIDSK